MESLPYGIVAVIGMFYAVHLMRHVTWWWQIAPLAGVLVVVAFDPSRPTGESNDSVFYLGCAMFLVGQLGGFLFEALRQHYQGTAKPSGS